MKMENIAAIGAGLGLRVLIDTVAGRSYTASALVGLWEGIVLNHFLARYPSSIEPYLALGFRLFVDFLFTESFSRLMITLLWTGLGVLLADVGVQLSTDYRFRRLWRKTQQKLPIVSSHQRRSSLPQRVRFYENPESSVSGSGSTTASVSSPGVPVRPTTTPVPGRYDQWSEATQSTGTAPSPFGSATVISPIPSEHELDIPEGLEEPRPRTPSELEYITLPVVPDTHYFPAPPAPERRPSQSSSRRLTGASYPTIPDDFADLPEEDAPAVGSGLTTPTSNPADLAGGADEDRPRVHSGLTTPEYVRSPLQVQTSGLPPAVVSVPPPPLKLTLADPSPTVTMPEPVTMPQPLLTPLPVPSMSEIPNIPTPNEQKAFRNSDPPPPFEEAIKEAAFPDDLSLADQESVISGAEKQAVIAKADDIRKRAREQEKERDRIRQEWRKAERQGRYFDALRLELELEDAQAQVDSLHAKAARRYYHGRSSTFTQPFVL